MIYILIFLFVLFLILECISIIKIDTTRYVIKNKKIDKDIKILLLSDLHNRNINNKLEKIINKENPDIILFSGDMVNEWIKETSNFINLCKKLNKYEVYYTFGNHEEKMSKVDKEKYYDLLSKTNIKILNNKSLFLSRNIRLLGLDINLSYFEGLRNKRLDSKYIESEIGKINLNNYNILIAHDPLEAQSYSDYSVDLVVSGHVHGGLVILPFLGGLLSPRYSFFPKYYKGLYELKRTKLIVSRGLGLCKRIPIRICNHAEVVVINIMKDE